MADPARQWLTLAAWGFMAEIHRGRLQLSPRAGESTSDGRTGPAADPADLRAAADAPLKTHDLAAWLELHGDEPEAVAIRRKHATAVMYRTVGRSSGPHTGETLWT